MPAMEKKRVPWEKNKIKFRGADPERCTSEAVTNALEAMKEGIRAGNIQQGMIYLDLAVDQLEQILRARTVIAVDDEEANKFKGKLEEYKKTLLASGLNEKEDALVIRAKLANYKLGERLLKKAFGSKAEKVEAVV